MHAMLLPRKFFQSVVAPSVSGLLTHLKVRSLSIPWTGRSTVTRRYHHRRALGENSEWIEKMAPEGDTVSRSSGEPVYNFSRRKALKFSSSVTIEV